MNALREAILSQTDDFTTRDIIDLGDWSMPYVSQTICRMRNEGLVQKNPGTAPRVRATYRVLPAGREALQREAIDRSQPEPEPDADAKRYDFSSLASCMLQQAPSPIEDQPENGQIDI